MKAFGAVYTGRRVLVTGHTGFKGTWLAAWLDELGAKVTGFAREPATEPNHWDLLRPSVDDRRGDVQDPAALKHLMAEVRPEIVFHLAAQPLVRASYRDPLETWRTNVLGVANVLDACRGDSGVRAVVIVTTDKVYENREWSWGYRENDVLGGHDPYSASKAAAEICVASYRKSFFASGNALIASARAGNVIGGGDWSADRLVPDLVRAMCAGRVLEIRSPRATRPWQHVLESLSGYLLLGQRLLAGESAFAEAWNFGPVSSDNRSVAEILELLGSHWPELRWEINRTEQPHEAGLLYLDCSKARQQLGWQPVWGLESCVSATAAWYRTLQSESRLVTRLQLAQFVEDARAAGRAWAQA
jgi:CDP-glucose 4,6-dehydratase